jgi:hypothetical protein
MAMYLIFFVSKMIFHTNEGFFSLANVQSSFTSK